jgi:hypothetical protein
VKVERHVSPDSLVVGEIYFVAGYYDRERRAPFVQPMVFIGRNLARNDDGAERRWFFQDYESYSDGVRYQDLSPGDERAATDFLMYPTDDHLNLYDLETVVRFLAERVDELGGRHRDSGQ